MFWFQTGWQADPHLDERPRLHGVVEPLGGLLVFLQGRRRSLRPHTPARKKIMQAMYSAPLPRDPTLEAFRDLASRLWQANPCTLSAPVYMSAAFSIVDKTLFQRSESQDRRPKTLECERSGSIPSVYACQDMRSKENNGLTTHLVEAKKAFAPCGQLKRVRAFADSVSDGFCQFVPCQPGGGLALQKGAR